ncbi:PilN domain-containing protein [Endothiovibrio diazotrophicus]
MARINLLPWREELRKERNQRFGIAMGVVAAVIGALVFVAHLYMESVLEHQRERNGVLEQEIAAVDKKIREIKDIEQKKRSLLARMNVIQELQSSRPVVVHLFDEMVRTLPEGVVLDSLAQSGDEITLVGIAQSNERISTYMRNLEASEWLGSPRLEVIQGGGGEGRHRFTLKVKQTWKKKAEEE